MLDKLQIRKRTEEVIKKSAVSTNLEDFIITHVPFKELKYSPSGTSNEVVKSYTEEELFNNFIMENKNKHNFLVVQGDNGSGKSHFIRWLKYKYDSDLKDDSEITILIERNFNTLQGTIEQLLQNEVIKKYVHKEELNKLSQAGDNISTQKFLSEINYSFVTELKYEEDEDCPINSLKRKKIAAFLVNDTVMDMLLLKENGPIDRIGKKLSNKTDGVNLKYDIAFKEEDFEFTLYSDLVTRLNQEEADKKVISCAEDLTENRRGFRKDVVDYLNSKMEVVIQKTIKLNSQDLNNIIYSIRSELLKVGKSLSLFIEDITSFTGIDRAIIENLIVEHTAENKICRLFSVVGITRYYYDTHFPDNLKDRVTGRIIIDKDSIIGDEKAVLDIASRYINAIHLDDKEIKQWVARGAIDSQIPIARKIQEWSTYKDGNNREFNIYPLNQQAILNLYNELQDKTPRKIISEVLYPVFMKFTDEGSKFPPSINELEGVIKIPEFIDPFINLKIDKELNIDEKDRFKAFVRIWGNRTVESYENNGIKYLAGIQEEVFSHFDIPIISGNQVVVKSQVEEKITTRPLKEDKVTKAIIENTNEIVNKKEENKPTINTEFSNALTDIKNWVEKGTTLKSHIRIRDLIVSYLKDAIYWEMEDVSQFLVDEALIRTNIAIEGQNNKTDINENAFLIKRNQENYYLILALIEYYYKGNKTWNFEGSSNRIVVVSSWLNKYKDNVASYVKNCNGVGYDIYSYAIANSYYINLITEDTKGSKDLLSILLTKELDFENEKLINVFGDYLPKLNFQKDEIQKNKDLVLKFYNCKLGDANINTTETYYLDTKEILVKINELKIKKWSLPTDLSIGKVADKWIVPYKLYMNFVSKELPKLINNRFNIMIENTDKFKAIIGDTDANDTIIEIKRFYKNLQDAKVFYDSKLYDDFDRYFIKHYTFDKIIEVIEKEKGKGFEYKVDVLKTTYFKKATVYLDIIIKLNALIENTYKSKENNCDIQRQEKLLIETKNELFENINDMIDSIMELNGGEGSAI